MPIRYFMEEHHRAGKLFYFTDNALVRDVTSKVS
jgi:hypothetical protein